MSLMPCPECNNQISDKAITCPSCGFPIKTEKIVDKFDKITETEIQKKKETKEQINNKKGFSESIEAFLFKIVADYSTAKIICPYCKTSGKVYMATVEKKSGIHGGKATAGIITGGLSLFFTGLSAKQKVNEYKCRNCNAKWIA